MCLPGRDLFGLGRAGRSFRLQQSQRPLVIILVGDRIAQPVPLFDHLERLLRDFQLREGCLVLDEWSLVKPTEVYWLATVAQ